MRIQYDRLLFVIAGYENGLLPYATRSTTKGVQLHQMLEMGVIFFN